MSIKHNVAVVKKEIETYQKASQVKLIAATKYVGVSEIRELLAAQVFTLGENKVQSLLEKRAALQGENALIEWHFIGHLQTNKIKKIIDFISCIQAVDSLKLAKEIQKQANKINRKIKILLEVNISEEESKYGFSKEEIIKIFPEFRKFDSLAIIGLMCMAPLGADVFTTRNVFRSLAQLRDDLKLLYPWCIYLNELSMGMSNDYPLALQEGASMVRIGSKLFQ